MMEKKIFQIFKLKICIRNKIVNEDKIYNPTKSKNIKF